MPDPREALYAELAGGVFFRCDQSGKRLLSPPSALAAYLGVDPGSLSAGLDTVLGADSPSLYADAFAAGPKEREAVNLNYRHPESGSRRFCMRLAPDGGEEGVFVVFLRDETTLQESRVKLAESQSKDVENSARLQAAVLLEGQRVDCPPLDYQTSAIPSKYVDGDFLDVLRLSGDSVDFILGDVMGKGMDAAILGAMIKMGFIRTIGTSLFAADALPDPAAICHAAEALVAPRLLERQKFATLTYSRLEPARRLLRFVDCGHTSVIHLSAASGECWRLKGSNMPLGFVPEQDYRSYLLPFEPGDALLLFTDGLSECCNRWGEALGEERVAYMLRTYAGLPASEVTGTILRLGFAYSSSGFNDDVSLICVRMPDTGQGGAEPVGQRRSLSADLSSTRLEEIGGIDETLNADLLAWLPGLEEGTRAGLVLAFHEALVNVVEHALPGGEGSCELGWRCLNGLLSIELIYSGPDYAWYKTPESPLGKLAGSGYGRFIMDEAMDSVLVAQGFHGRKRLLMCRLLAGEGTA